MSPYNEVRFRECLDDVAAYKPGRPCAPNDGRPTYKLSSNENPYPPLPGVLTAATEAAAQMNRYPDMGSADLLEALSDRFGVPTSDLAVGTGSVALLYHLLQASVADGDEVVYAWRSFEAYPIAVQVTGATSVQVPLTHDGRHDLKAMEAAITDRTKVVLVCTPNNPTGPVVRRDELLTFLDAVPSNVLVVLDEAYREFVRDPDVVDGLELYRDRPNVVVLRTFSKAYGLAGFRVGFAIGRPDAVGAIRKCALPVGECRRRRRTSSGSSSVTGRRRSTTHCRPKACRSVPSRATVPASRSVSARATTSSCRLPAPGSNDVGHGVCVGYEISADF
jgi:histidinol-phosphate aminotransferase